MNIMPPKVVHVLHRDNNILALVKVVNQSESPNLWNSLRKNHGFGTRFESDYFVKL